MSQLGEMCVTCLAYGVTLSQRNPRDRPGVFPVDPDRRSPRRMRPKETSGVVARFVSSSRRNNEGHGLTTFPYNSVCANGSPVSTPASNVYIKAAWGLPGPPKSFLPKRDFFVI